MKLAIAGFIVPFMFVFSHEMLMIDATAGNILLITITSLAGVFLLSVMTEGHFRQRVPFWLRAVAGIGALLLIYPGIVTDIMGVAALALLLITSSKKEKAIPEQRSAL